MKIKTDAWIEQWEADANFWLQLSITAPSEEERNALLDAMRDRMRIKITIELD